MAEKRRFRVCDGTSVEEPVITNTREKLREEAPGLILFNLATGALGEPGGFIETMEAEGQKELVGQTSQLPSAGLLWDRMSGHGKPDLDQWKAVPEEREAFEAMGIEVLGEVDGDPIWCRVKLPTGWRIEPTEHSMWSHLLDAKGRTRARIFYKAAFYDRSCHIDPVRRYKASYGPDDEDYSKPVPRKHQYAVYDAAITEARAKELGLLFVPDHGAAIYTTPFFEEAPEELERGRVPYGERAIALAEENARSWLTCNYPEHENPAAYWD